MMRVESVGYKEKILTKDMLCVMLVTFLAGTAITTQMGTLPLYVAYLGGSEGDSGTIVGILGIAALCVRIPIGKLLDRFGRKMILIVGLVILVLDFTLLNLNHQLGFLFLLRLIQGAAMGIENTAIGTMASDLIPKSRLSAGLGYFSIAQTLPSAIGPFIGLYIVEHYGFELLFLTGLILTILAVLMSLLISDHYKGQDKSKVKKTSSSKGILKVQVVIPSLVLSLICLANAGVTAFISQFALEKNVANIGYYFTVNALMTVLVRLIYPRFLAGIKNSILVFVSILFIILSFVMIAYSNTLAGFLFAAILYAIGFASVFPIMNAIVLSNVGDHERGQATSIFSASLDVAYGSGAMVWGFVAMGVGFSNMYLVSAILPIISLIIMVKYRKKFF